MTRKQVAVRLGKSIATIRRIEGSLLHPARDDRGVYRFDRDEVEALAVAIEQGSVTLTPELGPTLHKARLDLETEIECPSCIALARELEASRAAVAEQQRTHRCILERLEAERRRETATFEREARELVEQVEELMATIS
jgi:hypothetical protein